MMSVTSANVIRFGFHGFFYASKGKRRLTAMYRNEFLQSPTDELSPCSAEQLLRLTIDYGRPLVRGLIRILKAGAPADAAYAASAIKLLSAAIPLLSASTLAPR
jgi:hypothetical protein